jgi:hypothetical protein
MSRGNTSDSYALIGTHYPQFNKQDETFVCHVFILLFQVRYNFQCCQSLTSTERDVALLVSFTIRVAFRLVFS